MLLCELRDGRSLEERFALEARTPPRRIDTRTSQRERDAGGILYVPKQRRASSVPTERKRQTASRCREISHVEFRPEPCFAETGHKINGIIWTNVGDRPNVRYNG